MLKNVEKMTILPRPFEVKPRATSRHFIHLIPAGATVEMIMDATSCQTLEVASMIISTVAVARTAV